MKRAILVAPLLLIAAPPLSAQTPQSDLSMHLRTLAVAPRSASALLGAGNAALKLGDANAALGFFARAEAVDRRDGRAKAGLASALVMLERPADALRLFGEAVSLGVPEAMIVRDRGLAYDLRGDQARAQRDYETALRGGADDEVTRRYALSLGISGNATKAMALLDPLLRRQDVSAWRARTFILAMTGDVGGANRTARAMMPPAMASQLEPFFARLATLNPADRAAAVNFGTMPNAGQSLARVERGDPVPRPLASAPVASAPVVTASVARAPVVGPPASARPVDPLVPAGRPLGQVAQAPTTPAVSPRPVQPALAPAPARVVVAPAPQPAPAPVAVPPAARTDRLANVLSGITPEAPPTAVTIPSPEALRAARLAQAEKERAEAAAAARARKLAADAAAKKAKAEADARKAKEAALAKAKEEAAEKAAEALAKKRNPSRFWVQVASGSNAAGVAGTWRKVAGQHGGLKSRDGYALADGGRHRILAGPYKTQAEARAAVAQLAKQGLSAMVFTSGAGQEVSKIGGN